MTMSRRQLLAGTGALLTAGLASCAATTTSSVPRTDLEPWLSDTENYTEMYDRSGEDSVTVEVGADRGLYFEPAAILINRNTTVVWKWSGRGGYHDVVEVNGIVFEENNRLRLFFGYHY